MGNLHFYASSLPIPDCKPDFLVKLIIQPCQHFPLCHFLEVQYATFGSLLD